VILCLPLPFDKMCPFTEMARCPFTEMARFIIVGDPQLLSETNNLFISYDYYWGSAWTSPVDSAKPSHMSPLDLDLPCPFK